MANTCFLFKCLIVLEIGLLLFPLVNNLLIKLGIKIKIAIALSHFIMMNYALFVGFIRYNKGVTNSIWQPVKR